MSLQSQAVLIGHLRPDDLLKEVEMLSDCPARLRLTHKDVYRLIEVTGPAGLEILHVFLNSSVADDYRDLTDAPSTLVTGQLSPFIQEMIKRLVERRGGFFRLSEQHEWTPIDASQMRTP